MKPNKDDLNPNYEPNTSRAVTPNGYWISLNRMDKLWRIHTNDSQWYFKLDKELGYNRFDSSRQVLLNRLQQFATKHQLTFVLAKNDKGE